MTNDIYYFSGVCKWAKVHEPDPKFGNYEIDLYMNEESFKLFDKSGLQLKVKTDEDNEKYVKFRRPSKKLVKDELVEFGPPRVFLKGMGDEEKFSDLIGNGSEVTVKLTVFDTVKGKGSRLETVRVDDLVEFNKGEVHAECVDVPF